MKKKLKLFVKILLGKLFKLLDLMTDYFIQCIKYIAKEANNPSNDLFERFYYNFFIVMCLIIKNIITIILKFCKYTCSKFPKQKFY